MSVQEHKSISAKSVRIGIISLSTTRTLADDESGNWIKQQLENQGHEILFHQIIPDKADVITQTVLTGIDTHQPQIILMTGGTGISPGDVTIEAVKPLFQKELTAFGSLFTQLSYQEIGSAAILSRATAGVIGTTILFCMPGSLKACKLACQSIIFPELGHLVKHVGEVA